MSPTQSDSKPATNNEVLFNNQSMSLVKRRDGYWLYDRTRGMNLAMRAKSEAEAYQRALAYYHRRLPQVEEKLKALKYNVETFVSQVVGDDYEI